MRDTRVHQLAFVGIGLVGVNAVTALGVIWVVGNRLERELRDFGSALPAATQLAFDVRPGASLLVLIGLLLAVLAHRLPRAVLIQVVIASVLLALTLMYGLALWLPFATPGMSGAIK